MSYDATSFFRSISAKLMASRRSVGEKKILRFKKKKKDEEEPQQPLPQLQAQQSLFTVMSAVGAKTAAAAAAAGNFCGNDDKNNSGGDNNNNFIDNNNDNNNNNSGGDGDKKNNKFNNNNNGDGDGDDGITVSSSCVVGKGDFVLEGDKIKSMLLTQAEQTPALLQQTSSSKISNNPFCVYNYNYNNGGEYGFDFFNMFSGNNNDDDNNNNKCSNHNSENVSGFDGELKLHLSAVFARRREIQMIPKNISPIAAENYSALLPQKLPKNYGKKTLILDVDETLVHSSLSYRPNYHDIVLDINVDNSTTKVYVAFRPFLKKFLCEIAPLFEIVIFTASVSIYCNPLMNAIDPEGKLGSLRLYREHCSTLNGAYVKDLSLLGRDLGQVAILDNSPVAYLFQKRNAIPISSWFEDPGDNALLRLLPTLKHLAQASEVYDVLDHYNAVLQLQQEQLGVEGSCF